ncbi:hypothetical protein [Lacticaseibacillus paracasei]|uniref:hypothetical protein n=1 Tax=Lacticaseibacillus paracasei TaxID=1597 RepID=UPI003D7AF0B7
MSNETKRDVFEKALREWDDLVHSCGLQGEEAHGGCEFDPILIKYKKDYDAALPDDLPVIPKAVGEYIKDNKDLDLLVALTIASNGYKHSELWIAMHQNVFSLAWVLEAWIVEETGEIVKLEEEK